MRLFFASPHHQLVLYPASVFTNAQIGRVFFNDSWEPRSSRKNSGSHIDASLSRQPLVKGERLVRYEVNAVIMKNAQPCKTNSGSVCRLMFHRECTTSGAIIRSVPGMSGGLAMRTFMYSHTLHPKLCLLPLRVCCSWQCAMPVQHARTSEQARKGTSPSKNTCDKQVSSWRHISCHTDKNRYYT